MDTLVSPRTALESAISSLLPRYELLDELGQGGMGIVYRARDPRLERTVVLKLLPPHMIGDELAKKRFLVEAKAAAALEHPNNDRASQIGAYRLVAWDIGGNPAAFIRSYVSDADGKIYCEYDAPDAEAVRDHARRAGLPGDSISEVALEINPAMFM